jgi:hypothetical protein
VTAVARVRVARFGRAVEVDMPQGAVYSGDERTGRCECGHSWDRHHLQIVLDKDRQSELLNEEFIPGECLDCAGCSRYKDTGVKRDG